MTYPTWMEQALCAQVDSEIFFVERGGDSRPAVNICRTCPVAAEYLEWALTHDEMGVWGGTTDHQRRTLKTPPETCDQCGRVYRAGLSIDRHRRYAHPQTERPAS